MIARSAQLLRRGAQAQRRAGDREQPSMHVGKYPISSWRFSGCWGPWARPWVGREGVNSRPTLRSSEGARESNGKPRDLFLVIRKRDLTRGFFISCTSRAACHGDALGKAVRISQPICEEPGAGLSEWRSSWVPFLLRAQGHQRRLRISRDEPLRSLSTTNRAAVTWRTAQQFTRHPAPNELPVVVMAMAMYV